MRSIYALSSSLLLLLVIFLLSNEAQGIRLGNCMMKPIGHLQKITLEEEVPLIEDGFRKMTLCQNEHYCNSGNNRKLLTATSSPSSLVPSTTWNNEEGNYKKGNSKKEEENVKKKKVLKNSKADSDQNLEADDLQHYPDLIDIAEMDYSPAKRKPPIHN